MILKKNQFQSLEKLIKILNIENNSLKTIFSMSFFVIKLLIKHEKSTKLRKRKSGSYISVLTSQDIVNDID